MSLPSHSGLYRSYQHLYHMYVLICIAPFATSFFTAYHCTQQKYTYVCMHTLYGILHVFLHTRTCNSVLLPSDCKSWHSQLQWPPLWSNKLITVLIQSSFLLLLELQLTLPSQFFNKQSSLSSSLNLLLSILQALRVCEWDGCAVWLAPHVLHTHTSHAAVTRHTHVTWHEHARYTTLV